MRFNLDSLVGEYEELEIKLSDPEIFKDQKKVREVATRKKTIEEVDVVVDYKITHQTRQQPQIYRIQAEAGAFVKMVDTQTGEEMGTHVFEYPRWKAGLYCDPARNQFRQHPLDYLEGLEATITEADAFIKGMADEWNWK